MLLQTAYDDYPLGLSTVRHGDREKPGGSQLSCSRSILAFKALVGIGISASRESASDFQKESAEQSGHTGA